MAADTTHNGYTNYPTFIVSVWIDNSRTTQAEARAIVRRNREVFANSPEHCTRKTAESLEKFIRNSAPDLGGIMAADLLYWAFDQVNYKEIAEEIARDLDEE